MAKLHIHISRAATDGDFLSCIVRKDAPEGQAQLPADGSIYGDIWQHTRSHYFLLCCQEDPVCLLSTACRDVRSSQVLGGLPLSRFMKPREKPMMAPVLTPHNLEE